MNEQNMKIAQEFVTAMQTKNLAAMDALTASNLVMTTKFGKVGKKEFMDYGKGINEAMPDIVFTPSQVTAVNDTTYVFMFGYSGTHTESFNPRMPGVAISKPSGARITYIAEPLYFTIADGKVVSLYPEPGHEGGILDSLRQLGVKLPPLWLMRVVTKLTHLF